MVTLRNTVHHVVSLLALAISASAGWQFQGLSYPNVPDYGPEPGPAYMVDNEGNTHGVAPDKGQQNGPVWAYSGSLENYMNNLRSGHISNQPQIVNTSDALNSPTSTNTTEKRDASATGSSYWLTSLAPLGTQPLAPKGYKFFRNVVTDYGADNTGAKDATEAINAAVADGNRCGQQCANTFSQGAIVYFPPGTYKICSPVIQLYYTQFIGDAVNPPTIQGCSTFKGIALFDTDPYIPNGNGAEWFVNQNQFLRHIRNFVFDLTKMPLSTDDAGQPLVPTGIHWQPAQGTTLQNLVFNMPVATSAKKQTAVGIYAENGSGGFVSDLTFNGGSIGWRVGNQQYTARNLKFNNCLTAIQMIWDWGFTWQNIEINGGAVGFNISGHGGVGKQGVGSVSIIDTTISNVPIGILTNKVSPSPNIILDNVVMKSVGTAVQVDTGETLLKASGTIPLWANGLAYNGSTGGYVTGPQTAPKKAPSLLTTGNKLFVQSRPQYETYSASQFLVATRDGGCKNDGTGDQSACLNAFLQKAVAAKQIAFFPAGIYQVGSTVFIPTGSRVQGSSWSQIMGAGFYFSDVLHPRAVVQVGNAGDVGTMEIVEMLFTVRGNTAGAVLMEWNVAAETQGAAAMWDSHFRVGGAKGTDLDFTNCPKLGFNNKCMAATLMFHVTPQASGYFENIWAWVADHDNDVPSASQISVYGARGMLIESQGPSWFYGTSSEHSVMYNYQLSGAKDIYMGFIQTETPYYQPNPIAPAPFNHTATYPNDPDFGKCKGNKACAASWGLRIIDSDSVTIHGAGHYSFFQNYAQTCQATFSCQEYMVEVKGSKGVVIFNMITVATSNFADGIDNTVLHQVASQQGFTTEDAIWIPLPGNDHVDTVFLGTPVFTAPVATCNAPTCLFVLPTSPFANPATINIDSYTTSFEYGTFSTVTTNGFTTTTFETTTTTTVLSVPPLTVGGMSFSNYNVTSGMVPTITVSPSVNVPPLTISLPDGSGHTTTRVITLPPWPAIEGTQTTYSSVSGPRSTSNTYYTGVTSTITATGPTVTTITFPATLAPTTVACPPDSVFTFATPAVTIQTECPTPTTWTYGFKCPTTTVVTFLGPTVGTVSADCTFSTIWQPAATPTTTTTTTTPLPIWTTWPPGQIIPVTNSINGPQPTPGSGSYQRCDFWFFFICINTHIEGLYWSFPPGIYPPGPPPWWDIQFPPGFSLRGTLPPWPRITIGNDNGVTYSSEPTSCKTQSASICSTTTSFGVTVSGTTTKTTTTAVSSVCETITGCSVSYSDANTATTSIASCTATGKANARRGLNEIDAFTKDNNGSKDQLEERADPAPSCETKNAIVYPQDPRNLGSFPNELANYEHEQIQSTVSQYTAYFWVKNVPDQVITQWKARPDIAEAYHYYDFNQRAPIFPVPEPMSVNEGLPASVSTKTIQQHQNATLEKRASASSLWQYWHPSLVSTGRSRPWPRQNSPPRVPWQYNYDDSAGSGMTIYGTGETGVFAASHDLPANQVRQLQPQSQYGLTVAPDLYHGTNVAGAAIGVNAGIAKRATYVSPVVNQPNIDDTAGGNIQNINLGIRDNYLDSLLTAWDDMHAGGRSPQNSIINISWGTKATFWTQPFLRRLYEILKMMDSAGVTIVVAAGNAATVRSQEIDTYPQMFAKPNNPDAGVLYGSAGDYLPNLIVVGATDKDGERAPWSQTANYVTTYAAGRFIYLPSSTDPAAYNRVGGTSYSAPQVAGLAAYFKALPSIWRDQLNRPDTSGPAAVKALILRTERFVYYDQPAEFATFATIWNGMDENVNCLLGGAPPQPNGHCPDLPDNLTDPEDPPGSCGPKAKRDLSGRQAGSCTLSSGYDPITLSLTQGPTAGPTCPGNCGGVVCTGYYCAPTPTGFPPGFLAPNDPSSSGILASPTTITQGFPPSSTGGVNGTTSVQPPPTTTTTNTTAPAQTSAPADTLLVFSDNNCKDFITSYTLNELELGTQIPPKLIGSFITGSTPNCFCPHGGAKCMWKYFILWNVDPNDHINTCGSQLDPSGNGFAGSGCAQTKQDAMTCQQTTGAGRSVCIGQTEKGPDLNPFAPQVNTTMAMSWAA